MDQIYVAIDKKYRITGVYSQLTNPGLLASWYQNGTGTIMFIDADGEEIYSNLTDAEKGLSHSLIDVSVTSVILSLDYDYNDGLLFWTEFSTSGIYKAFHESGHYTVTPIYNGTTTVNIGLAVDWVSKNIYWTDSAYNWIMVSDYNGLYVHPLIITDMDHPTGIVVDPSAGVVYWSDIGTNAKIEIASLNGEHRRVLVSAEDSSSDIIETPIDLTIDYEINRLFWIDAGTDKIMSIDLIFNTVREEVIGIPFNQPIGITLDANFYFVSDVIEKIFVISRTNTDDFGVINAGGTRFLGIVYFSSQASINNNHLVPGHRLIFSTLNNTVCSLPVNFGHSGEPAVEWCFMDSIALTSMDYIYNQDMMYGYDALSQSIVKTQLRDNAVPNTVLSVTYVQGISIDWLTNNLYFSDSNRKAIYVCTIDGDFVTAIVTEYVDQPSEIIVHPEKRYLFWGDIGEGSRIERSSLSGRQRRNLTNSNMYNPSTLTIDLNKDRLYWIDTSHMYVMDLDGNGLTRITNEGGETFFGVAIFQDQLYWTIPSTRCIGQYDLSNVVQAEFAQLPVAPQVIMAYDKTKQQLSSGSCDVANGGCDEICIPTDAGPECLCSLPLSSTCISDVYMDHFMLVADATMGTIFHLTLLSDQFHNVPLPIPGLSRPIAIDFDPVELKLYWTDISLRTISRASLDGSGMEIICSEGVKIPAGIALDIANHHVYWTDAGTDRIYRANMDGSSQISIIKEGLDDPRGIVLDEINSFMYWSDVGDVPKIEQANLDGSGRHTLVDTDIVWPNGLALDYNNSKLYWCDARTNKIEYYNLNYGIRHSLIQLEGKTHPFSIAVDEDYIYWTDRADSHLQRADKETGLNIISRSSEIFKEAMDLYLGILSSGTLTTKETPRTTIHPTTRMSAPTTPGSKPNTKTTNTLKTSRSTIPPKTTTAADGESSQKVQQIVIISSSVTVFLILIIIVVVLFACYLKSRGSSLHRSVPQHQTHVSANVYGEQNVLYNPDNMMVEFENPSAPPALHVDACTSEQNLHEHFYMSLLGSERPESGLYDTLTEEDI
uniref:Low-density lipoprotein receptor-related protein 4-like n=1 Tax=Saccoglossus kowalevskii TaxID=10224 RepID=A0ABM0MSI2_SACKO|nr:PREDICTED: low-density lipoprotein receptor-related protein 4-like [Saccoglossus kowalevskii]